MVILCWSGELFGRDILILRRRRRRVGEGGVLELRPDQTTDGGDDIIHYAIIPLSS